MKKSKLSMLDLNKKWTEEIEKTIKTLNLLYKLYSIRNQEKISESFFQYCRKGKYFVVIALYNSNKELFVKRDFFKREKSYELVGGWINTNETLDQALERIVFKETGSVLVEASPIATVENNYFTDKGRSTQHIGVAYLGRVLQDKTENLDGIFTNHYNDLLGENDLKICKLSEKILEKKLLNLP